MKIFMGFNTKQSYHPELLHLLPLCPLKQRNTDGISVLKTIHVPFTVWAFNGGRLLFVALSVKAITATHLGDSPVGCV